MAATEARSVTARVVSPWQEMTRMQTNHVPIVLGGLLAALAGIVTFALELGSGTAVPSAGGIFLILFGATGLVGYAVSKANVQNGALVAAIAGLAILALTSGTTSLFTGLLLLAGAVWTLAAHRY